MRCRGHGLPGGGSAAPQRDWDLLAPSRDRSGFVVKCRSTPSYNCIAWAVGDQRHRWSYSEGDVWPVRRSGDADTLRQLFEWLGYEPCSGPELEPGYVKVALYATAGPFGSWQHAARQLPDGTWSSKCGNLEGVLHKSPACVEGRTPFVPYGSVYGFMRARTSFFARARRWFKRVMALTLPRTDEG